MKVTGSLLLAVGLAAQQAEAQWYLNAPSYSSPENTDNSCNTQQQGGFDWSGLSEGDSCDGYGGFGFSGLSYSNSFAKRDLLKRTFQSGCATGSIPYGSGSYTNGPQMTYDNGFSVSNFQVTTDRDTDVTFCYGMPDGSICRSTHSCSPSGTYVSNDQCGGATSVGWEIPDHESDSSDCGIGFHGISFDCSPPASTVPYVPSSTPNPYSTPEYTPPSYSSPIYSSPAYTPPGYTPPAYTPPSYSSPVYSSPGYTPPAYTPPAYTPPAYTSSPVYNSPPVYTPPGETSPGYTPPAYTPPAYTPPAYTPPGETSPVYTSPAYTPPGYTPPAYTPPGYSSPVYSSPVYVPGTTSTTVITYSTVTTCPAGYTVTSSGSTYTLPTPSTSTIVITSTSTICTKCSQPAYTPPPVQSSSPPPPQAPCPEVLPKCLNTWIFNTGCKDNSDYSCYCQIAGFTKNVISCVDSWSDSESIKEAAMSYMAGICAPYIPKNPGIITYVPSTITVCPTPTNVAVNGPASTITLTTTEASACMAASCTVQTTVYSTGATTVTIPQVYFTTATVTGPGYSQTGPGLVPGTPTPVPANATPYYPVPSSLSSVYVPKPTGQSVSTNPPNPTAPIPTGAAIKANAGSVGSIFVGAAAAMLFL